MKNPALKLLEDLRECTKDCEDITELEKLHVETLWQISLAGEEIEIISEEPQESLTVYLMEIGENYYILIAQSEEEFSLGAFMTTDDEFYYDIVALFDKAKTKEEVSEA